jgi:hypothetical protein
MPHLYEDRRRRGTAAPRGVMGYIIHVRVEAAGDLRARRMAVELVGSMHEMQPAIDVSSTTVSDEEQQNDRQFVFCGAWIDGTQQRCLRPSNHDGVHCAEWRAH